jgi:hypothetical protein
MHEDHFQVCWKCAGKEMEEQAPAEAPTLVAPPQQQPEPRLRSSGSILARMVIAFVIGAILGGAASYSGFLNRFLGYDLMGSLSAALWNGAVLGGVLTIVVGILFWVIFPYEPSRTPVGSAANSTSGPAASDAPHTPA